MNPIELFHKDGKPSGVFYCEKCRIIHRTLETATQCCDYRCKHCGATCPNYWVACSECSRKESEKREAERFAAAEKVYDYDGPIYCDGIGYDGYSADLEEFIENCDWCETEAPDYVWTCNRVHFAHFDYSEILERIGEQGYEDFDPDDLNGIPELKAAIEKFNEANAGIESWEPNYKRAFVLPESVKADILKLTTEQ